MASAYRTVSTKDARTPQDAAAYVVWESSGALTTGSVTKVEGGFEVQVFSMDGMDAPPPNESYENPMKQGLFERSNLDSAVGESSGCWAPFSNPAKPAGR